jgi:hypothetical protein
MTVEPTGVLIVGLCEIQTEKCSAKIPAPITAVWALPARRQINVCSRCLDEMIRNGEWQIEGARLRRRADVVVFDRSGNLQLVVEAKYIKPGEDAANRAVQIRRNLLAHSGVPDSPFFLIVFPDHFYLWKKGTRDAYDRQADYSVDTEVLFKAFGDKWNQSSEEMSGIVFERLVSEWIKNLSNSNDTSQVPEWAQASGLYDAIKQGSVVTEASV